jgi:hypothetical protein
MPILSLTRYEIMGVKFQVTASGSIKDYRQPLPSAIITLQILLVSLRRFTAQLTDFIHSVSNTISCSQNLYTVYCSCVGS